MDKGKQIERWKAGGCQHMAISPDGKVLAEASRGYADTDKSLTLRDLQSGQEIRTFKLPAKEARFIEFSCLTFAPDGQTLAVGNEYGSIHFFDVKTGKQKAQRAGLRGAIKGLAYSFDGRLLASSSLDATVLFWEVKKE
jgi:WD40 repeat protein